ncbi:hypothetical protein HMPREF3293_00671 [Christensenella minuta]|uniref:Uncharacterized protein n=1 Tax=Christensenella minuta TaxID=626937 RepID=A0A136Q7E0_9FIRM|nr:hypothetical protein HMPREF3293_00671 [Christensenella minuta]
MDFVLLLYLISCGKGSIKCHSFAVINVFSFQDKCHGAVTFVLTFFVRPALTCICIFLLL